jgi:flagellar basal body-associated protein FliL
MESRKRDKKSGTFLLILMLVFLLVIGGFYVIMAGSMAS